MQFIIIFNDCINYILKCMLILVRKGVENVIYENFEITFKILRLLFNYTSKTVKKIILIPNLNF